MLYACHVYVMCMSCARIKRQVVKNMIMSLQANRFSARVPQEAVDTGEGGETKPLMGEPTM